MNPQTAPKPDLQALALTKAIRQQETGGRANAYTTVGDNGTSTGAYQFQKSTWQAFAKQVLGDANAPMTDANQNAVAYGMIKTWKDQGLGPAQIAAKWNSGSENGWENKVGTNTRGGQSLSYNTPAYVKGVVDNFKTLYPQVSKQYGSPAQETAQPQQSGGPAFPYAPGDTPLTAGLKSLGNLPGSAYDFAKGTVEGFNPVHILNNVGQIGTGFGELANQEGLGKAFLDVLAGIPKAAYETLVPEGVRDLISGDTQKAQEKFTNDPFGQAAPIVMAAVGGAKALDKVTGKTIPTPGGGPVVPGKTMYVSPAGEVSGAGARGMFSAAVDSAISKVGGAGASAVGKVASTAAAPLKPVMNAASSLTRSLASHLTSLAPETITQIVENPESFSKVAQDQMNRGSIFDDVAKGLDELENQYSENGKLYQAARSGPEIVTPPENFIRSVLEGKDYKFKIIEDSNAKAGYRVEADSNSFTRDTADLNAINNFVDNWGGKQKLTTNEFLNMRSDLAKMGKFGKEIGRNDAAELVSRDLRAKANEAMRPQISGLKDLDAATAPQIELLKRVRKDLLNGDGSFKDNAISKVANALGKENLMERLEKVSPGIAKRLQILKAVEDIERAKGIKIGAYTRGALEGYGVVSGNIAAIATAIITNPTIAVPLIRGLSLSKAQLVGLLNVLKVVGGDVNNAPSKILE